jgi:hypothetical protein
MSSQLRPSWSSIQPSGIVGCHRRSQTVTDHQPDGQLCPVAKNRHRPGRAIHTLTSSVLPPVATSQGRPAAVPAADRLILPSAQAPPTAGRSGSSGPPAQPAATTPGCELLSVGMASYPPAVARVDPEDDSICRFVVRHYRYDPDRHERRHVVVAAFDNKREFAACMEETAAEIRGRRERGEAVDPTEHVTGEVQAPGHRRRQQNARLIERAAEHGVRPANIEDLELPPGVALLGAQRLPWRRRLHGWFRRRR